jgi:dTDP-4-dehydrorhamnose 3,5-epimerase
VGRSVRGTDSRSDGAGLKFHKTPLAGAYLIELELVEDSRGFFARSFCVDEFARHGLDATVKQCNVSFNKVAGTLRGLHYQIAPHEEAKLVRCTMGAIYDVILDLRRESETRGRWFQIELTAENRKALFIPKGFAHGFQTLSGNSEVLYQMSESYHPECARGVRWDDPAFEIRWPLADPILSDRDRTYPLFDRAGK